MLTGFSKIYLDTAPFIYYLEKNTIFYDKARNLFMECYKNNLYLVTSFVTYEEYCVFPFSKNDFQAVNNFSKFVAGMNIHSVPVDERVALNAASLRAKYKNLKALDALHLATSLNMNCDIFITNDKQLLQVTEANPVLFENL